MPRLLHALPLSLFLLAADARAQLNNWDPTWYATDSALVFHDDLDFYLNGYTKKQIKDMRRQVSILRMNFDKMMRQTIRDIRAYSEGHGMDPRTHDFTLPVAQGGPDYHLAADQGKVRAFMFVSMTNPPARYQMAAWNRLVKKYEGKDARLFVIYGRELHPGDKGSFKKYPRPSSQEQKLAYAKEFAELSRMPVLVDDLGDTVLKLYGNIPNGAYVVDADGRLVFRGTWADDRKIEHIVDTLLKWYAAGRPKGFVAK